MVDSTPATSAAEPTSPLERHALLRLLASPPPSPSLAAHRAEDPPTCSAAASANTSTTTTSSSSHKCSLSFILANGEAGRPDADLPLQRLSDIASFGELVPSLSTPAGASTSAQLSLDAALASPNERAKVKRRRAVPSARSSSSSSSKKSGNAGLDLTSTTSAGAPKALLLLDGKKGSKYCIVDGCASRAKHARRCWKHGGSVKCKVPECVNRAKTKGVCWSHGGGTICSFAHCGTISVSNGVCWAHGGGKRCGTDGCSRPAYERTANLCSLHFEDKHGAKAGKDQARRRGHDSIE